MLAAVLMVDYTATPPLVEQTQTTSNKPNMHVWSDKPTCPFFLANYGRFATNLDSPIGLFSSLGSRGNHSWEPLTGPGDGAVHTCSLALLALAAVVTPV